MPQTPKECPNKWAILVGIEFYGNKDTLGLSYTPRYSTGKTPILYKPLEGSVNDVLAVREYLIDKLKVKSENITTFLAPRPDYTYSRQLPEYFAPTYRELVKAFKKPKGAVSGDLVYIHYSGHGARATTLFEDLKQSPSELLDEALVPSDVLRGGRYLRDLELGYLLHRMANDGLVVTAVLDCCHSGGAARGDEDSQHGLARNIPEVYKSDPVSDQPYTNMKTREWSKWLEHWHSGQYGFFSLTACQEHETATERPGTDVHGWLTYWLLKVLKNSPRRISSQALYTRIIESVRDSNRYQTPHYIGDSNRSFFSNELRSPIYSLTVLTVDLQKEPKDRLIYLNGGLIHGVQEGSVYAILRSRQNLKKDVRKVDESSIVARVRVEFVEAGRSATLILDDDEVNLEDIKGGCPAILQTLPISKESTVRLKISNAKKRELLRKKWISNDGDKYWLSLVDSKADFTVTVDKKNMFLISGDDTRFNNVVKMATRPIPFSDVSALIRRLQHLARLNMTKRLANPDVNSKSRLIDVKVRDGVIPDEFKNQYQATTPMEKAPGSYEVQEGGLFTIRVRNRSNNTLGCVILNCTSEFSVDRIFPKNEPFKPLQPKSQVDAHIFFSFKPGFHKNLLQAGIPIVDSIKVFACSPERDLDPLILASLHVNERSSKPIFPSGLDGLLHDLDTRRYGESVDFSAVEPSWDTEDIDFHVTRSG